MQRLCATISPPTTTTEVVSPGRAWGVKDGRFGLHPYEHVDHLIERPEADPREALRARIELPEARLEELNAQDALDLAEQKLKEARRAAWARHVPAADAVVRAAVTEIAALLDRAAAKTRTLADVTVPALNAKIGRDPSAPENAPPRYHVRDLAFSPLVGSDPRSGSLFDHWRTYVQRWLA